MRIIAFVGLPASGKSEAAGVALKRCIPVVRMGDVVREEVRRLGLPLTDENVGGMGTRLRQEEGMDAIARRCIPWIELRLKDQRFKTGMVVVDGVRNLEEVQCFRGRFGGDFVLVAIKAPQELRFERMKLRCREDDALTLEEFRLRDDREKGWGLLEAMESADFVIENVTTLEAFQGEVARLLEKTIF